jgi:Flp pilus assembly pilin Flp
MLNLESYKRCLMALYDDEHGTELIEWVMLTVIVALAGYTILTAVPGRLSDAFEHVLRRFVR